MVTFYSFRHLIVSGSEGKTAEPPCVKCHTFRSSFSWQVKGVRFLFDGDIPIGAALSIFFGCFNSNIFLFFYWVGKQWVCVYQRYHKGVTEGRVGKMPTQVGSILTKLSTRGLATVSAQTIKTKQNRELVFYAVVLPLVAPLVVVKAIEIIYRK